MADPDEPLDVHADDGTWLGVKGRAAVHRDGDWHHCVHLWVMSGDGVLLQRRAGHKASWPGKLDATAAGHVGAGETVEAGGAREVLEELGVAYAPGKLTDLGTWPMEDRSGGLVNREVQHVWAVRDPRPLEQWVAWDRHELDGLVLLALADLAAFARGEPGPWSAREWDGARERAISVARDDVVPAVYLPELVTLLQRRTG